MLNPSHEQEVQEVDRRLRAGGLFGGGVAGNARLTALTGLALLALLFLEGLTIPAVRRLLVPHVFLGLLLIPPLGLKLGSTGYRFLRYYTGNPRYRAAGPPHPLLRVLAPLLILTVVAILGSGIMLLVVGPVDSPWRRIHVVAFFAWFWIMTIHVLAYTPRALRLAWSDRVGRGRDAVAGAMTRRSLLVASPLLGVAVAIALLPLDGSWAHAVDHFRGDG